MKTLANGIWEIGQAMVNCTVACAAASCSRSTPPRCLWLECDSSFDTGVIVVGLNPGHAKPSEQQIYKMLPEMNYATTVKYLQDNHGSIDYFRLLRSFTTRMIGSKNILWTEVAKCELKRGLRKVPLSMQGTCASQFLRREIELVPKSWPILAAGADAYHAAALLFADRPVIGVPHPTGAYGNQFSELLSVNEAWAKQQLTRVLGNGGAVWLGKGKANLAAIEFDEDGYA